MGKNSKKLRRQEYPDCEEMMEFERHSRKRPSDSSEKSSSPVRPSAAQAPEKPRSNLVEGQLVSSGNISGVVFLVTGDLVLLMDGSGIIHEKKHFEVYLSQN